VSRILAYTSPARGHLYPLVPILKELQRRGHSVALRTIASQVAEMRVLALDARAVSERIERIELDDYKASTLVTKGLRALATFTARAEHEVADLRSAIDDERPDALLVDCLSWGACAVAQTSSIPWAQYVPHPLPARSPHAPPYGPGLRPARGALGHLRDLVLRSVGSAGVDRAVLPALNSLRAEIGAPTLPSWFDIFTLAPLILYLTAEPFEYRRSAWPERVRMVGPCPWDPPSEPPSWLPEIRRPLVLVSTSTELQRDSRLVSTALRAFAEEDVGIVATLPAVGGASIDVPANAHLARFVPHSALLAHASCAITHGGAGVTQKALAASVPVCVVPFGRDQYEIARRVELAGAGTRLPAPRLSPRLLRAKVRQAMTMRAGARAVAEGFAAAGGHRAAADSFEALLGRRSP
jgi:MGT family glycosyltransferase